MAAAVLFDLDQTLMDRDATIARCATRFAEDFAGRLVGDVTSADVLEAFKKADKADRSWRGRVGKALRDELPWRSPPDAAEVAAYLRGVYPRCAFPRAGALGTLLALRVAGASLGLISNGRGAVQRAKLNALRLTDAFDTVIISGEVGVAKPDVAIFDLGLDRLRRQRNFTAGRAWFIGDDPLLDVDAARRAGLRAVWLRNGRAWPVEVPPPEFVIEALAELIPLITQASRR